MSKNNLLPLLFILISHSFLAGQVISIEEARSLNIGNTVTVRGVVTNGAELGAVRYLQDGTAGIAAYPGTGSVPGFEANVGVGDSIEVTGQLDDFQGLLEITPITSFTVISSNNLLPEPKTITLDQLGEEHEGQLVRLDCISFTGSGTFSGSGTYNIADDDGNSGKIYLRLSNTLQGNEIPSEPVELIGLHSQFFDYQLLPRGEQDLNPQVCFFFTQRPEPSNLNKTSFTVSWELNKEGSCKLIYGETDEPDQEQLVPGVGTAFSADLSGLDPGKIYWIQIEAIRNGDTVYSQPRPMATVSNSSGEMNVYFTHPVDESSLGSVSPSGTTDDEMAQAIIERIESATSTIDVSLYNNTRIDLTNHLKLAHSNGITVRYIAAINASNPSLEPPPAFPHIFGNAFGLMHNKFLVIDADIPEKAWVITGSANWTTASIGNDFNNLVMIQDQSLARAYRLEFEEMWGSDDATPNTAMSRFGSTKLDNTPHKFEIGGIPVSLFFSPSDNVTKVIENAIESADEELSIALLTFTKNELGNAVGNAFVSGVNVRGLVENINDQGSEVDFLQSIGVPIYKHSEDYTLHHKYGVVDANYPGSDPVVITGSHNWTQSAESSNDENTILIHDADYAMLYQSEFNRRWVENVSSSTKELSIQSWSLYPNPAVENIFIQNKKGTANTQYSIYGIDGREIRSWSTLAAGDPLPVESLIPGMYFVKIKVQDGVTVLPFQKI